MFSKDTIRHTAESMSDAFLAKLSPHTELQVNWSALDKTLSKNGSI